MHQHLQLVIVLSTQRSQREESARETSYESRANRDESCRQVARVARCGHVRRFLLIASADMQRLCGSDSFISIALMVRRARFHQSARIASSSTLGAAYTPRRQSKHQE